MHGGIPLYLAIAPPALTDGTEQQLSNLQNFTLFFPKEGQSFKGCVEQMSCQCYT